MENGTFLIIPVSLISSFLIAFCERFCSAVQCRYAHHDRNVQVVYQSCTLYFDAVSQIRIKRSVTWRDLRELFCTKEG